jgi:hypothetical protein
MSSVQVTLKVLRWEERDKRLVIKDVKWWHEQHGEGGGSAGGAGAPPLNLV